MQDVAKYSTRISYSVEDQGYVATVPELPGCSAFGETAEEALAEIRPAIEAWISATQEAGNPIPAPAPIDQELPSGKFLVRVARTVHAQLATSAQREGISLNQYVSTLLATATLGDVYARATVNSGSYTMLTEGRTLDAGVAMLASGYIYRGAITSGGFTAHATPHDPTTWAKVERESVVFQTQSAAAAAARAMATTRERIISPPHRPKGRLRISSNG
jgi:antitoxin HicB